MLLHFPSDRLKEFPVLSNEDFLQIKTINHVFLPISYDTLLME